jgi:hypothetical protein
MSEERNTPLASLTGAKQTMSAWTRVIETEAQVPPAYKSFFKTGPENHSGFPYVVFTPSQEKFLHKTPEKLICDRGETLQILERTGSQVVVKNYPYQTLHRLEVGSILLASWITLRGVTSEGVTSSATIEYNAAVGERHLAVFLKKLRPAPREMDEAGVQAEKDKFDYLSDLNFKFMNYGRNSLVRGEKVLQILLQPEIREPAWSLPGWTFYRTVTPAHLTILTDQELILIREDERGKEIRGVRYGGVWQYLPLRSLRTVSLSAPENDRLSLTITLPDGEKMEKIFAAASQAELEQLHGQLLTRIGEPEDAR